MYLIFFITELQYYRCHNLWENGIKLFLKTYGQNQQDFTRILFKMLADKTQRSNEEHNIFLVFIIAKTHSNALLHRSRGLLAFFKVLDFVWV